MVGCCFVVSYRVYAAGFVPAGVFVERLSRERGGLLEGPEPPDKYLVRGISQK